MAKKAATTTEVNPKLVGSGKYQYVQPVNPEAKMFCGKTGINKKFKDLTDENIEKMIAEGNKAFSLAE